MKKLLLLFVLFALNINAQTEEAIPFYCDYNAYLFQFNDVYAIDLASGNAYEVATDVTPGSINAAAYNPADGFIWGYLNTPDKTIVRIGKNFKTTNFYIPELPSGSRYVGDISSEGIYYFKSGGETYYKVDLNPESANYGKYMSTETLSLSLNVHDWAFNAVDNNLYSVEKGSNILYRINPENGVVTSLGEVPILAGLNYTYGAVYFDLSGRFYVSSNQTGTIYVIQNVQDLGPENTMDSNLFAFGPSSSSNDGARCPTAPVPQEICFNGIDDDGDGLIDCEDPSCSGYGECEVIAPPTTTANKGGLESNNRLSEKISKRNFNRAKTSYRFDKNSAKKVTKSSTYGKKAQNKTANIALTDFIPMGAIGEDQVIESSPTDLVNITNATSVYSVDYIRNEDAVASILVLKTENGVYEHTKYICDRLLGASLISVATIEIKEQKFIRALIRNIDGSLEFVLSLSAKATNSNTEFGIESHWNLDKYESNVPFYNFQIWSNSLDDLVKLGEEVVRLLHLQKPVTNYNNSTPPTVFVRKGSYHNGKLDLQVVNTNKSKAVVFDGGLRTTESHTVETVSTAIDLDGNYISNLKVDAGNLFDIGFRIGDGIATPDDLFLSDGPWGYDDAAPSTTVNNYTVATNTKAFQEDEFPIERNIALTATTSDYIAAYRALTPKFNAIDFTDYNSFQLSAKGTGTLIVRLVKAGINTWETQYKTSIALTSEMQDYNLPFAAFTSTNNEAFTANDVTSVVFTMLAENGVEETKTMHLAHLRFSKTNTLTTGVVKANEIAKQALAIPNPMQTHTSIVFNAARAETLTLAVYNQMGAVVKQQQVSATVGSNRVPFTKGNLKPGLYFCKLKGENTNFNIIKLLIQ